MNLEFAIFDIGGDKVDDIFVGFHRNRILVTLGYENIETLSS